MPTTTTRAMNAGDLEFSFRVYASTREEEMAMSGWNADQQAAFLWQQFNAQHHHYQQNYPDASFELILLEDEPIGRLYVDRCATEIRVIDIALLTEYRGRGIGGQYMRQLLGEAEAKGLPVTIHVMYGNVAQHLYDRLGFQQVGDAGFYCRMEWKPQPVAVRVD